MRSLLVRYKTLLLLGLLVLASVCSMLLIDFGKRGDGALGMAATVPAKTVESEGRGVESPVVRQEVESESLQSEPESESLRPVFKAAEGRNLWPVSDQQFADQLEEAKALLQELDEFLRTGTFTRAKPEQMVQKAESVCDSLMFLECMRHGWYEPETVEIPQSRESTSDSKTVGMTFIRIRVPGADWYAQDDPVLQDLDAHYDCAYYLEQDWKGEDLVEVISFPRDQYPVINGLKDAIGRLKPSGRRSIQLGLPRQDG